MEQFTKAELSIIAYLLRAASTRDAVAARIADKAQRMRNSAPVRTITPEGNEQDAADLAEYERLEKIKHEKWNRMTPAEQAAAAGISLSPEQAEQWNNPEQLKKAWERAFGKPEVKGFDYESRNWETASSSPSEPPDSPIL